MLKALLGASVVGMKLLAPAAECVFEGLVRDFWGLQPEGSQGFVDVVGCQAEDRTSAVHAGGSCFLAEAAVVESASC